MRVCTDLQRADERNEHQQDGITACNPQEKVRVIPRQKSPPDFPGRPPDPGATLVWNLRPDHSPPGIFYYYYYFVINPTQTLNPKPKF